MITREEALNKYRCYSSEWHEFLFEGFLNYIYDDFEQQLKEANATIEALQEPKSCDGCKYYDGSHECNNQNSIAWETSNRVYPDDYCKDYEPKDEE